MYYVILQKSAAVYGTHRVALEGLGMPGSGQFKTHKLGREEKGRLMREKRQEKQEDEATYGEEETEE